MLVVCEPREPNQTAVEANGKTPPTHVDLVDRLHPATSTAAQFTHFTRQLSLVHQYRLAGDLLFLSGQRTHDCRLTICCLTILHSALRLMTWSASTCHWHLLHHGLGLIQIRFTRSPRWESYLPKLVFQSEYEVGCPTAGSFCRRNHCGETCSGDQSHPVSLVSHVSCVTCPITLVYFMYFVCTSCPMTLLLSLLIPHSPGSAGEPHCERDALDLLQDPLQQWLRAHF